MMRLVAFLGTIGGAAAHGAMVSPAPRNAIDSELPAWDHGKHAPQTGVIEPLSVGCTNGTEPCAVGQSVFWFSQGCTPGCKSCDGNGTRFANWDHCADERSTPYKPKLAPQYRSALRHTVPGSPEDIWKYQPWRSPGMAPVADPCGMAGGSPKPGINGGEYTTTHHEDADGNMYSLKQGDLGSHALKKRPTGTVWKSGGLVNVSWYIAFNHGGGYKYRICPAKQPTTEACFAAPEHQLEFATEYSVMKFAQGDRRIQSTLVKEGGGIGWKMNPIPNNGKGGSTCDDYTGHPCPGCPTDWAAGKPEQPTCTNSTWPFIVDNRTVGDVERTFANQLSTDGSGMTGRRVAIQDEVRVPKLPAGEYVVGFRWDCETSSQVWSTCADVTIV